MQFDPATNSNQPTSVNPNSGKQSAIYKVFCCLLKALQRFQLKEEMQRCIFLKNEINPEFQSEIIE